MKKILHRNSGELIHEYDETATIDFSWLDLIEADLYAANLRGSNLYRANLTGADLIGADLIGANLIGADLRGANLIEADLSRADLIGADLRNADLRGADLSRADLRNADLTDVKGIKVLEIPQEPFDILCLKFLEVNQVQIGCTIHPFDYFLENYKSIARVWEWSDDDSEKYLSRREEMEEFFREGTGDETNPPELDIKNN